ncbi:MAG: lipopolysaccharide core heptose(II) kinase RfaY [Methanomethylovorans sp.]|uniref:ABC1 kinase family protein n=1 Tax=Methanomethylovorans sp. TaxID=2758717 RepID=UPI000B1C4AD7|nr:lipopolysaccharide core heptose(II) kinase RfaY [Methanomethylovorans sp.]
MFKKTRRYLTIFRVFIKYNLFFLLYKDIKRNHISNNKCTCNLDLEAREGAAKLRDAFEELGPSFIKLGQMLSRRPDIVPRAYVIELQKLQDKVKPLDFDQMRPSFETGCACSALDNKNENMGINYEAQDILEIFDEFDTKPIASASIGQVYKGVLNGKEVAVKISRPGLIDIMNLDLAIIEDIKPLIVKIVGLGNNFDVEGFLREFREVLISELDYRIEARNMMRFYENFKDDENVLVPRVYTDYSRENILVMDFVEGVQVKDLKYVDLATRTHYAKLIASSYLKQVYIDGFYHADPHGGNIIVKEGKIAFIDFGAVDKLDNELKRDMLNLFYGVYTGNVEIASDAFLKIGKLRKEEVDISRFRRDMDDLIADQKYGFRERKSDNYAKIALKYNMSLPSEFSTLEKSLMLIESVCLDLDPEFNLMDVAKPVISKALRDRYAPKKAFEAVQLEGDRYLEIFRDFPAGINDVIETIRGYRFEKLQESTYKVKRYRLLDRLTRNLFLAVVALISAYLIIQGENNTMILGTIGFLASLFLSVLMFQK